jgi:hypothetical protein
MVNRLLVMTKWLVVVDHYPALEATQCSHKVFKEKRVPYFGLIYAWRSLRSWCAVSLWALPSTRSKNAVLRELMKLAHPVILRYPKTHRPESHLNINSQRDIHLDTATTKPLAASCSVSGSQSTNTVLVLRGSTDNGNRIKIKVWRQNPKKNKNYPATVKLGKVELNERIIYEDK